MELRVLVLDHASFATFIGSSLVGMGIKLKELRDLGYLWKDRNKITTFLSICLILLGIGAPTEARK